MTKVLNELAGNSGFIVLPLKSIVMVFGAEVSF
jgi:hypothetical protein